MRITSVEQMDAVLSEAAAIATKRLRMTKGEQLKYDDPNKNEKALFDIIHEICLRDFTSDSVIHVGGHKFPDIIFPHANAGVEVKCHKREGDALLGNSIMGSTFSISEPKAVRLLVWTNSNKSVNLHDYFESVVGAEVTHSPRFRLRPGAPIEDRLFGDGNDHIGPAAEVCLGPDGIDSELILARMRAKALAEGNFPWWIGDDKSMASSGTLSIIRFSNLQMKDRLSLESISTFLFPGVMGQRSQTKYHDVIAWAIATRGVLLSRDNFSARGRVDLQLDSICAKHSFRVPRSFASGLERLSRPFEASLEEIRVYWNVPALKKSGVVAHFLKLIGEVSLSETTRALIEDACDSCRNTEDQLEALLRKTLSNSLNATIVD